MKPSPPSPERDAPLRVLVAPDKFKGTLTAGQSARAIASGLRRAWPGCVVTEQPLSDGGDGFTALLVSLAGGRLRRARTIDAAGRACHASWGWLPDRRTAIVDTAACTGLARLPPPLRSAARTSSFGTGLLMRHAIAAGSRSLVVGLGGSATNDGGMGIAAALGYRFFSATAEIHALRGESLGQVVAIERPRRLPSVEIIAAGDVSNPLLGPRGATRTFGPQKGATSRMVARLESAMRRYADVVERSLDVRARDLSGAGAAGGIGFALAAFFGARFVSGFSVFAEYAQLDKLMREHDLVVTGEGCFDRSSLHGKGPHAIAQLARRHRKPVWGIFGRLQLSRSRVAFDRVAALTARGATAVPRGTARQQAHRLANAVERLAQSPERARS